MVTFPRWLIEIVATWNAWQYSELKNEILGWSELDNYQLRFVLWGTKIAYYVRSIARWDKFLILLMASWEWIHAKTCSNLLLMKNYWGYEWFFMWSFFNWERDNEQLRKFSKIEFYVSIGWRSSFASNRRTLSRVQRIPSSYFSGGDRRSIVINIFNEERLTWRTAEGKNRGDFVSSWLREVGASRVGFLKVFERFHIFWQDLITSEINFY